MLMLSHAFEKLDLNRGEFLTDYFNDRSRCALLRLGANEERILRSHRVMLDGRVRDSVIYSIIKMNGRELSSILITSYPSEASYLARILLVLFSQSITEVS